MLTTITARRSTIVTLPFAWLRGQATLAALDEWTLRGVPAAFGAATILLLPLLPAGIGRAAVVAAALMMALSPAMVFYSRMYIQESMFACFTLAFAIAIGRAMTERGWQWPMLAGIAAGLAAATKETAVIVLPASLAACALAWWSLGAARSSVAPADARWRRAAIVSLAIGAGIASLFYSSFLTHPRGILEPLRGAATYFERGVDPAGHVHPWHYYLGLLAWSSSGGLVWTEAFVLVLAAAGVVTAWTHLDRSSPETAFWRRYLTANAALTLAIFSAIPYKTPWNLLPFYAVTIVAAGIGVSALARATASRAAHVFLAGVLAIGCRSPGMAGVAGVGRLRVGPAQSVRLRADGPRCRPHGRAHPRSGRPARRGRAHAGDGDRAARRAMAAALVSADDAARRLLDGRERRARPDRAGHRIVRRSRGRCSTPRSAIAMFPSSSGVRPDVLLTLYVERGLWDRFLSRAAGGGGGDRGGWAEPARNRTISAAAAVQLGCLRRDSSPLT